MLGSGVKNVPMSREQLPFYQHVLKLKPSRHKIQKIGEYSQQLIVDQDTEKQNKGLELLRLVNSNTNSSSSYGVEKAIEQSIVFLQQDSELVNNYLQFIFEHLDPRSYSHKIKLKELIREGLKPERTEQTRGIVFAHINNAQESTVKEILDELIEYAQQTSNDNAREQIKQILIRNKDTLNYMQQIKVKEIYGDSVLS